MRRFYTAESVTEGHPDKVCDQIADAILDECLRYDPSSRVACEVLATRGNVFVAGEITSGYEPPVFDVIRKVLEECGYCTDGIEMDTFVHQQSPDIAKAVSVSKEFRDNIGAKLRDRSRGAGDQGVMVGYACDDTPQLMPMPTVLAHRITRELSACRRSGYIKDIFSDGKAQVTVEYEDGKPVRLESVVVSCQHGAEKSLKKLDAEIREKVLRSALRLLPPDDFDKILATMRSRGISCSIIIQNIAQMKALFKDSYESLIGNCDEFLYLGGNEKEGHKYVSELLGKETLDTNTYGQTKGRSGSYSVNYQQTGRELLTPDEIRLLDNRKAILFIRGERPIMDDKYDLKKHVNFRYTEDGGASPYDYAKTPLAHDDLKIDINRLDDYELLSTEDILGE